MRTKRYYILLKTRVDITDTNKRLMTCLLDGFGNMRKLGLTVVSIAEVA